MDIDAQLITILRRLDAIEGRVPAQITSEGPVGARDADGSEPAERFENVGKSDADLTEAMQHAIDDLTDRVASLERFADVDGGPYAVKANEVDEKLASLVERQDAADHKVAEFERRLVSAEDAVQRGVHGQPQDTTAPATLSNEPQPQNRNR